MCHPTKAIRYFQLSFLFSKKKISNSFFLEKNPNKVWTGKPQIGSSAVSSQQSHSHLRPLLFESLPTRRTCSKSSLLKGDTATRLPNQLLQTSAPPDSFSLRRPLRLGCSAPSHRRFVVRDAATCVI